MSIIINHIEINNFKSIRHLELLEFRKINLFIGKPNENWHLEFTQSNEIVNQTNSDDDILVFYPNNKLEYKLLLEKIKKHSIEFITTKNTYWNENGKLFLDPDGYRIVISHLKIE